MEVGTMKTTLIDHAWDLMWDYFYSFGQWPKRIKMSTKTFIMIRQEAHEYVEHAISSHVYKYLTDIKTLVDSDSTTHPVNATVFEYPVIIDESMADEVLKFE